MNPKSDMGGFPGSWPVWFPGAEATPLYMIDSDPYIANVVALLHFDGANASTTFTDVKGKTWLAAGNAQINTAQSKFSGASLLMDGTGDQLNTASHADFGYGTGDFTIEYWLRVNAVAVDVHFDQRIAEPSVVPTVYHDTAGVLAYWTNGAGRIASAVGVITTGAFQHIAISRVSAVTRLFVNGTQRGASYADANNYVASPFRLGDGFGAGGNSMDGWFDDLRITKGIGRYTTNFMPPSAAFPDA